MGTNLSTGVAEDIEIGVTTATSDESLFANWVVDIEARVGNANMVSEEELLWKDASIYKVPAYKRELNPRAFTPVFVSFGPFHYDDPKLKKMEVHKERALVHFLKRTNQSLQYIKPEVAKILVELRVSYCCLDDRWTKNDDEFLKMMILDGCFTLEILRMLDRFNENILDESDYSDTDPCFSLHAVNHNWPYIRRDMLLIENQLPLLLLKTLVQFENLNVEEQEINRLVLNLVGNNYTMTGTTMGLHALDLFRHSLLGSEPQQNQTPSEPLQTQLEASQIQLENPQPQSNSPQTRQTQSQLAHSQSEPLPTVTPSELHHLISDEPQILVTDQFAPLQTPRIQYEQPQTPNAQSEPLQTQPKLSIIRCATELHEAGVRFKKSQTNNLKNIRFDSITGKFHLPILMVDDETECSLLNVITFEFLYVNLNPDVTIYVTVMDEIIDSANDVRLLHKKGLILNALGSDEEVAVIFNKMGKEITMHHDDNLSEVRENVSQYCRMRRHRWISYLVRTYFRNPWTIISLAGALLIVALTIAQTIYASHQK